MAKKMDKKLIENYNKKWYRLDAFYKKNTEVKIKTKHRKLLAVEEEASENASEGS